MHLVFSLIIFLVIVNAVHMHVCLWAPMQRDTFDISTPGSVACRRKIPPCGGINATSSSPRTSLVVGSKYKVEFQQNLNHYYTGKPGALDISFAVGLNPSENDFRLLHSVSDYNSMNQITQTNYSIEINLPNEPCDECVLRVRYLTNNPAEAVHGTTFHQCSDIKLTNKLRNNPSKNEDDKIEVLKSMDSERKADSHDCCVPESYSTLFFHYIPAIDYRSQGVIFYDQKARQMRVIVVANGGRGNTTYDGSFDMWMNFTSGNQYYYNRNAGTCDLYGLDYWNDWCFGNKFNQSEDFIAADVRCKSSLQPTGQCNQWRNGQFTFETLASNACLPSSRSRPSGERVEYAAGRTNPIPPAVFIPDAVCLKQTKVKHASPQWMKMHPSF